MALSTIGANQLALTSAAMPAGSVLQCVTTNYSNDFIFTLSGSGNVSDNGTRLQQDLNCCYHTNVSLDHLSSYIYIYQPYGMTLVFTLLKMLRQRLRLLVIQIHHLAVVLIFLIQAAMP